MKTVAVLALLAGFSLPARAELPDDVSIYAVSLVGSPYRLGGSTPETGLDCSGFVGHVFHTMAGVQLPRDSRAIFEATAPLPGDALQAGDLVFFNTLNRAYSHVGIYLGENRFVHASSSRTGGVMVSNLDDRYWRERYEGARRVVRSDATAAATP